MIRQETIDQKHFILWLRMKHPRIKTIISPVVKYGGNLKQRLRQGRDQKEMGYVKGTLDVFIPKPRCGYHGLFIEFKTKDGRISDDQRQMAEEHNADGYKAVFAYSTQDAIDVTEAYLAG